MSNESRFAFNNILTGKSSTWFLRVYTLISLFSFAVILIFSNLGIHAAYMKYNIHEAEDEAIGISLAIFKSEKEVLLTPNSNGEMTLNPNPGDFVKLDESMHNFLSPLSVVKIKIFSRDAKIVYSTDHTIIGQIDANNEKLDMALNGKVVSEFTKEDEVWDLAGEKRMNIDLVETYSPIRDENNNIIGSFEIYLDISHYQEGSKIILKLLMAVIAIILFLTFGFLFILMRKSTKQLNINDRELNQMAYYDQLTNLPNRTNFLSYLGRMIERTKWQSNYLFAVLFIDLDNFKIINDSLGHIIGDKLLVEVARRLEKCTRPTDRISRVEGSDKVSRFGGDEFALFLNDVKDISSATRVANRIQQALQKPFNLDGHELYTSASIGIALSATGYKNAEDVLRDADSAMYRAKDTGRAHAEIFDDEMHVRVSKILQLESDLRTAVEEEQFMVYYQPIVSATDSRITGAEALLRWNHPQKGFISPMDFIPIAEETGLISTIGEWVLRTACAQNKAWQDAGYKHLLMKVNFSSRQFKDENLIEAVKKVIRETGMPAQLLDMEITESISMADNSIKILNQLTAMGLQTSIDDFGTGYSSIGSLTRFPINTIKIDRTFIKDIAIDVNAEAIIKAIIAMAHSLNMDVIAEGVETEEQLAFLQSEKCDKIQGYLFSRPVPGKDYGKLLEKEKTNNPLIQKLSKSMV